jgi:hypothetical protein
VVGESLVGTEGVEFRDEGGVGGVFAGHGGVFVCCLFR